MSEIPAAPAAPQPAPPVPSATGVVPGKGLGIAGLILAIVPGTGFIGLVLSIIGLVISRNAGFKNRPALAGIIVAVVLGIVYTIIVVLLAAAGAHAVCNDPSVVASGGCTVNN